MLTDEPQTEGTNMRVPAGDKGAASITNQRPERPYGGVAGGTHGAGECHVRTFACVSCSLTNVFFARIKKKGSSLAE